MNTTTFSTSSPDSATNPGRFGQAVSLAVLVLNSVIEGAEAAHTYRQWVGRGVGEQEAARKTFERHFAGR